MKKTYDVKTEYGTYKNCSIITDTYRYNNALAVMLENNTDGPIATITVCIDSPIKLENNESFVDTNNCPWAPKFIEENHLGEPTGTIWYSGYCSYPLYRFNIN